MSTIPDTAPSESGIFSESDLHVSPEGSSVGPAVLEPLPPERNELKSSKSPRVERSREEIERQRKAEKAHRVGSGIDWIILFWLVAVHVGALAAPWTFTWQGLAAVFLLHWLTGGIGICLGYHRYFTHRSFATKAPIRWFLAFMGSLAGEGSVIHWVANHRKHHALSDEPGDPHSPLDGPWWSHMLWFMPKFSGADYVKFNKHWAPDLEADPVLRFLDRGFVFWHVLTGIVLFGLGYAWQGPELAWSLLVWGLFLRMVLVLHSTWFVNSASHMWGYRNYETTDESRNLWWVALITYGEGWHNNHHAFPRNARHGHRWWEFDVTFLTVRMLEKVGLAWDVVDGQQHKEQLVRTRGKREAVAPEKPAP